MDAIAIIGAGMAGLTAAARLVAAGRVVRVFDKSRGIGGRLATRRNAVGAFDHGAPVAEGGAPFDAAMAALGDAAERVEAGWRGRPEMSGLLKPLAAQCDVVSGCRIARIDGAGGAWRLVDAEGAVRGDFAKVIVAVPAPQAAELLPGAGDRLRGVAMEPCWTLMSVGPLEGPPPEAAGPIAQVVDQAGRPGAAPGAFVAHAGPDWSRDMLERPKDEIAAELARHLGLNGPGHVAAHRWRHARTMVALGAPFLDCGGGLVAGGDWALGPKAGHAWESGCAMADALAG